VHDEKILIFTNKYIKTVIVPNLKLLDDALKTFTFELLIATLRSKVMFRYGLLALFKVCSEA